MFAEEALANSEKKLELQIENKFPEAENIVTDRTKLLRIITILIDNAIKFTDAGHVSYSCGQEKNGWFHFSVTDTGIGIPDDKISTIFDNFTQADGSSNREYGGNGVGLAIVRGLVYFLGGTIHVKSEYGKGTQFDCHIPLSP